MAKVSQQSQIPRAAIRTMAKDLAGIVFEEWEALLTEAEIEEILKRYKKEPEEFVKIKEGPTKVEVEKPKIEVEKLKEEVRKKEEEERRKEELKRLEEEKRKEEE
ncbi:MAG: hypothetical protein LR000_00135, partial [Candidatus Pacebacteria bacterium]|nr:hypothetical protein [Candidatus Paceibacterota bacterium]